MASGTAQKSVPASGTTGPDIKRYLPLLVCKWFGIEGRKETLLCEERTKIGPEICLVEK